MKLSQPIAHLVGLSLAVALAVPAAGQTTTDDLKKEIDSLRTMLQAIQKDLQEMKGMMVRPAAPPPSGIGAVIDFGNSPIKGERTAKLTLLEFSDYQ